MGTESDIRSKKKDDIVGTFNSICHKGHLRIMFNVLFGFSISEKKKLRSFGINTSVYKHVSTIVRILGTDSLSRKF